MDTRPRTLGELKRSGWQSVGVKDEMRRNLMAALRERRNLFPGILGYDDTVIPQLQNAILARHDILLLGLRGQAKTRIARALTGLLDLWTPALDDTPLRDDPFRPVSKAARRLVEEHGENAPIRWIHRDERYHEKLATPDVNIADLIGDVDPIKAVSRKLDLSDEEAINYGLIPRSNRGIFAINELPDLQARIQVGLFNILEEQDVQIRGFPVRMPLDLFMVFTANPEDYTNRGNIITPLKDRIAAQILTHYPETMETGVAITRQEAWASREGAVTTRVPDLMSELIERVTLEARASDYVDRNSGVSARLSIALMETVVSAAERRALLRGETQAAARVCDLFEAVPAMTGKVELVYQGEQEGILKVAYFLVGKAIKEAFNTRFLKNYRPGRERNHDFSTFQPIIEWFERGEALELAGDTSTSDHLIALDSVGPLRRIAADLFRRAAYEDLPFHEEFILEGLAQNFVLTKQMVGSRRIYRDAITSMMGEVEEV